MVLGARESDKVLFLLAVLCLVFLNLEVHISESSPHILIKSGSAGLEGREESNNGDRTECGRRAKQRIRNLISHAHCEWSENKEGEKCVVDRGEGFIT